MALQLGELREALIEAGASEEKANKAAEEVAGYDKEFAEIKSDLKLLKWAQTVNFVIVSSILLKLFLT